MLLAYAISACNNDPNDFQSTLLQLVRFVESTLPSDGSYAIRWQPCVTSDAIEQ